MVSIEEIVVSVGLENINSNTKNSLFWPKHWPSLGPSAETRAAKWPFTIRPKLLFYSFYNFIVRLFFLLLLRFTSLELQTLNCAVDSWIFKYFKLLNLFKYLKKEDSENILLWYKGIHRIEQGLD